MKKELKNTTNITKVLDIILLFFIFLLCSCQNENDGYELEPCLVPYEMSDYTYLPEEVFGILENKKIYITSIGQSIEANNFEITIKDKFPSLVYTKKELLKASEVEKGSVVLAVIGCSIKGLSESETTYTDEIERAREFSTFSKNNEFILINLHLGGESRRGKTSDDLIRIMFTSSYFNIFYIFSNNDKYLTNLSFNNHIKCYQISSQYGFERPFKYMLGIKE